MNSLEERAKMRHTLNLERDPLAIADDEVRALNIPEHSFLGRYLDYASNCTDAPLIYHLGVGMSILAFAAGKCDLAPMDWHGQRRDIPIRMWTGIVGTSGSRKSQAMSLGMKVLKDAGLPQGLPDDASTEAWHDTLSMQPISILQKEELSGLFDATQRTWSQGLTSWLLSMWEGHDKGRSTKGRGDVTVTRPRLNILGGIPIDVLSAKTSKRDWRSGFLPRFTFWRGQRLSWLDVYIDRPDLRRPLSNWIRWISQNRAGRIDLPYELTQPISDWFFRAVEQQQDSLHDALYSALSRMQEKALLFMGLYHISNQMMVNGVNTKQAWHYISDGRLCSLALDTIHLLDRTVRGIYGHTSNDEAEKDEDAILKMFSNQNIKLKIGQIQKRAGFSRSKTYRMLQNLMEMGYLASEASLASGRGRPATTYFLSSSPPDG